MRPLRNRHHERAHSSPPVLPCVPSPSLPPQPPTCSPGDCCGCHCGPMTFPEFCVSGVTEHTYSPVCARTLQGCFEMNPCCHVSQSCCYLDRPRFVDPQCWCTFGLVLLCGYNHTAAGTVPAPVPGGRAPGPFLHQSWGDVCRDHSCTSLGGTCARTVPGPVLGGRALGPFLDKFWGDTCCHFS